MNNNTKIQPVSLGAQLKMVKSMVELLNETFVVETDGIPCVGQQDRKNIHFKIIPPPHFSAHQSILKNADNPIWYINTSDYWSFSSKEFDEMRDLLKIVAQENGFELIFSFQHIIGIISSKQMCKENKLLFIGSVESTKIFV